MSWDEDARRVAEIFGVKEGEALPDVSRKTLRTYHAYLKANLAFPLKAKVEDLDGDATIHSLFALKECPELPASCEVSTSCPNCLSATTTRWKKFSFE